MSEIVLDETIALVLIDLQKGILNQLPTSSGSDEVFSRCVRLAEAFRSQSLPVVLVRVAYSADGGDLPPGRVAQPRPRATPSADFREFPTELGLSDGDIIITKRHWGAFTGTELDLQLRRRGVTQIVLAGISTSMGVESTARSAWEHNYYLTFAEDATVDANADSHLHSFSHIFPRLGQITTTHEIIKLLNARSG